MQKYNVILIEDELQNMQLLRYFITNYKKELEIVGEASNVEEAIEIYQKFKPEIVFLDIQLHNKTAFDFLNAVDFSEFETVFITAYSEYAVKAFKYNVVDYIVKPIDIEEIKLAAEKCIQRIKEKKIFENSLSHSNPDQNETKAKFISIPSIDKINLIKKEDIVFCKSEGRYTTFYLKNNEEIIASKNLGEYESILGNTSFFRIHHSYIINLDHLININKKAGYTCEMVNNINLPVAKRRHESLKVFLSSK